MTGPKLPNVPRPIVLASSSPRRHELLRRIVDDFEIIPSDAEERTEPAARPEEVAKANARAKALAVAQRLEQGTVIGADTVVAAADGGIVGKPIDRADARTILARLAGSRHCVITGVCVVDVASGRADCRAAGTWVTMRAMSAEEIEEYVGSGEADGKAGAYAIQ
ncbi:MAG: septum formation protein Maf, partial [Planctomycetes bacterium]|nr:septum formation protein Maf [Planctomycetota bacterium]